MTSQTTPTWENVTTAIANMIQTHPTHPAANYLKTFLLPARPIIDNGKMYFASDMKNFFGIDQGAPGGSTSVPYESPAEEVTK